MSRQYKSCHMTLVSVIQRHITWEISLSSSKLILFIFSFKLLLFDEVEKERISYSNKLRESRPLM